MIAKVKEWRPASYISSQQRRKCLPEESANPYALIILNQPISNTAVFSKAYNDGECILWILRVYVLMSCDKLDTWYALTEEPTGSTNFPGSDINQSHGGILMPFAEI